MSNNEIPKDFAELLVDSEREQMSLLHERLLASGRGHLTPRFHNNSRGIYYYHRLVKPPMLHVIPMTPYLRIYLNDEIKSVHSFGLNFEIDAYGQYYASVREEQIPPVSEMTSLIDQCLSQLL